METLVIVLAVCILLVVIALLLMINQQLHLINYINKRLIVMVNEANVNERNALDRLADAADRVDDFDDVKINGEDDDDDTSNNLPNDMSNINF